MMDNRGQVSLEYLLIFAISMILLIAFTLPLTDFTIQTTLDVSDSLDMKSDLSKLSQAIQTVYGQGQGSRQIVNIISQAPSKIDVTDSHVSCNLKLKDGSRKLVKVTSKSNLAKTTIPISEGTNTIVVEWPVGSETMNIHKTG
ncbi:MAG: class III signal peptide-containing protein [Methanobrevibacter sp.]|uniref:class III signal peptide-containing protein n=1 Tax=uncultured Methanobrevibacter sp. TaxID=253161 RepID=UPI00258CED64|nr:class III signal peptide-containing protein [uncultured Methanobrevibacter sp.]MBR2665973.1 class III signal peptide-containing protein [Methanobrevibacter sp.]MBR3197541.1 class III signal peptide-containing protein [Methanobrevibacter sp.]MBR7051085.1 class III signal peptide-containing protein [Methanobrevibacter sp.]